MQRDAQPRKSKIGQGYEWLDIHRELVNERSVTPDYLVCLEDGRKLKSLKRHLLFHGLTPDEYRKKWGLDPEYPMVAPRYAEQRSALAKTIGFGRRATYRAERRASKNPGERSQTGTGR